MGGVGHWPLDVIKRFVPIVMEAIGCLVQSAPWKRSQLFTKGPSQESFENILFRVQFG